MPHKCEHCNTIFSKKIDIDEHIKNIKDCMKCAHTFISQYAFINDSSIPTKVCNYIKDKNDKIACSRGHELVFCQGPIIKKHFRHKYSHDTIDNGMSEWHSRMQGYFPITEKHFAKKEHQIKERRADVYIENENYVIEMQHSEIDDANIICRNNDYLLHGCNLIWIIDGNTKDVEFQELSSGNKLIIFNNKWKYKSFEHTYDFILLERNNMIYKIAPKRVCNQMIMIKYGKKIEDIIDKLKDSPQTIYDEWEDDNEIKATLNIHQKGAGNGKTWGVWNSILTNLDKELFIIITKQHSAVAVIYNEFIEQAKREEYHVMEGSENYIKSVVNRKHIIKYKHKTSQRECCVIIGTIDSFIYNIRESNGNHSNLFEGLAKEIKEQGCNKIKYNGLMTYGGKNINLNRFAEIWIDEAQDLNDTHLRAFMRLMYEYQLDINAVGDKLQSLEYKNNFITEGENISKCENNNPNINVIYNEPINQNRRIYVSQMADEINNLIHFEKYALPKIETQENIIKSSETPIEILKEPNIYNDTSDENDNSCQEYIDKIINKVDKEVNAHNYSPNDFIFIFPIMKNNYLAAQLETKLNAYWINKLQADDTFQSYAVLHKHTEGTAIDMSLSENASRIVSIRTSKGDGRKVAFTLGCNEKSLKLVARTDEIGLIYESYIHVALTRAKSKIYFGLQENNDDIHARFAGINKIAYIPKIKTNLNTNDILSYIDIDKTIDILKDCDVLRLKEDEIKTHKTNDAMEWEYYCIRRALCMKFITFRMLHHCDNKSQILKILKEMSRLPLKELNTKDYYNYLNKANIEMKNIPICKISNKNAYERHFKKIMGIFETNSNVYKKIDNNPVNGIKEIINMKVEESIIHWYAVELFRHTKFHETSPITLYRIIDFIDKNDTQTIDFLDVNNKIKILINGVMDQIKQENDDDKISWNVEHTLKYDGTNDDYKLMYKNIPTIGWSDNKVYHFHFASDFNSLNYWNTVIEIILERFIIYNTSTKKGKDSDKFKEKPIDTYLLILKDCKYEKFVLDFENTKYTELKNSIKNAIIKHFESYNEQIYNYWIYIRDNREDWKDIYKTPFGYLSDKFEDIPYIKEFFKDLHKEAIKSKERKLNVKEMTYNKTAFCEELTKYILNDINRFFSVFNKDNNVDDDSDDDW